MSTLFECVVAPFLSAGYEVLRATGAKLAVEIAVESSVFDLPAAETGLNPGPGDRMVIAGVGVRRLLD